MKTTAKNVIREESGKILILVLVLLVVGGLLLTPLLGLMSTGLMAGQVYEKKASELYAADAGVEEAVWRISKNLTGTGEPFTLDVNEKDVVYTIDPSGCGSKRRYVINSTAYTDGVGSTTVTVDVYGFSFPDNAITSRDSVNLKGAYVDGFIQHGGDLDWLKNKATFDEEKTIHETYENWPRADDLYDDYYAKYVASEEKWHYCYGSKCEVDANDTPSIGPLYRDGDLILKSTDNTTTKELKLTGTVYVTGRLEIGKTEQDFILNLNGKTIFCEGVVDIGGKTEIRGSGNIIAGGDLLFKPRVTSRDGYLLLLSLYGFVDFLPGGEFSGFVMSVNRHVNFQPGGTFYGSVAGDLKVTLDSGVRIEWVEGLDDLIDFPFEGFARWRIRSYNIS